MDKKKEKWEVTSVIYWSKAVIWVITLFLASVIVAILLTFYDAKTHKKLKIKKTY